jgi:hypothetical protein
MMIPRDQKQTFWRRKNFTPHHNMASIMQIANKFQLIKNNEIIINIVSMWQSERDQKLLRLITARCGDKGVSTIQPILCH